VPVYGGGPVETEQLILVSWQWLQQEQAFQLHFGIEPEKAAQLIGTPGVTLRAFLGYSGWSQGQLEGEMKQDTWIPTVVEGGQLEQRDGIALWRAILGALDPELKLLADEPEDPTVN